MGNNQSSATSNPLGQTATLVVAGESLPTFLDEHFAKVRQATGVPEDFLANFVFSGMKAGGGKGGQPLGFTKDRKYLVKELNKTDHEQLSRITEDYVNHVTHTDGSLLVCILAHFYSPERRKNYIAMNNVIPLPAQPLDGTIQVLDELEASSPTKNLRSSRCSYDLKGCADDKTLELDGHRIIEVHKRIWNFPLWCGQCFWSKDRLDYYAGKLRAANIVFHITPAQYAELVVWLKRDVDFLTQQGLMDYSLMVACERLPCDGPGAELARRSFHSVNKLPFFSVYEDELLVTHLGVIDFLQNWTCTKNIAMCIKFAERNKATVPPSEYGARFVRHFRENFQADAVADSSTVN